MAVYENDGKCMSVCLIQFNENSLIKQYIQKGFNHYPRIQASAENQHCCERAQQKGALELGCNF